MIKFMRAALRGIRAELSAGESGWVALSGSKVFNDFGVKSDAGPIVSSESIMRLSAAWGCIVKTSQLVATLPLHLMERRPDASRVKVEDQLLDIVAAKPNAVQTAPEYWEGKIAQILTRGNSMSEKQFIGKRLVGLRPLLGAVPVRRDNGTFEYHFSDRGKIEKLPPEKVFHLRNFGAGDGLGLSSVRYGVQSFGAALAADRTAASVFSNSMMPSGTIDMDGTLTPDQREQLQNYLDTFSGSGRAGKVLVLEGGLKWNPLQITPEDAQLLETRRFQVEDICRWFGVPPIIIGHSSEGQTMWGTGVESIMLSWLTTGINPLLRRIEARMKADLIPADKRSRWYFEFNREAMLQMDSKTKGEYLSKLGASGTLTANERRIILGHEKHSDPAADDLLAQRALAPLKDLREDNP